MLPAVSAFESQGELKNSQQGIENTKFSQNVNIRFCNEKWQGGLTALFLFHHPEGMQSKLPPFLGFKRMQT